MKSVIHKIQKRRLVAVFSVLSFLFVIGGWVWSCVALKGIHEPLIIHFNNLRGINQVGNVSDLSKMGILAIVIVGINTVLAFELEEHGRFWGKFVAALTFLLATLLFIGFAAIINVN